MFERLGQFARARLYLVEQPHVLDRDHRLIGENGGQFDMPLVERPHGVPAQQNDTRRSSLAEKGHAESSAIAPQSLCFAIAIFRVGQDILDLDGLALQQDSSGKTSSSRRQLNPAAVFNELGSMAIVSRGIVTPFFPRTEDLGLICLAQPRR